MRKNPDTISNHPEIMPFWDYLRNAHLDPTKVSVWSHKTASFLCPKCKAPYDQVIRKRCFGKINEHDHAYGCPNNNLVNEYPEVAIDWDYGKNYPKTPYNVKPHCNKGYFWNCRFCGRTTPRPQSPNFRVRSASSPCRGCPYCSGLLVRPGKSFGDKFPHLVPLWHPDKNGELTPYDFPPKSGKKVWWRCPRGHEWPASICDVSNGRRCGTCFAKNSYIQMAVYCELKKLFPNVMLSDRSKKKECDISVFDLGFGIEVDSKRFHKDKVDEDLNKDNYFNELGLYIFRLREHGLPMLSNSDVYFQFNEPFFPIIARLLRQVLENVNIPHELKIRVSDYIEKGRLMNEEEFHGLCIYKSDPPKGRSLQDRADQCLLREWDEIQNYPISPANVHAASGLLVNWVCPEGHTFKATICNRFLRKSGCPVCANHVVDYKRSIAHLYPALSSQLHESKNGNKTADKVSPGSGYFLWWSCPLCGVDFQGYVYNRVKNGSWCCRECQYTIRIVCNWQGSEEQNHLVKSWCERGIELGFVSPHYLLGRLLYYGIGCKEDVPLAKKHLMIAADKGSQRAKRLLEIVKDY
ncbi:MAG: zinc-ribbon domain-containing protein [Pseudomonadota bacterium]|nr:zinc-ribbon domain-containing protein [Pseudomonadota bacterium]